LPPFTVHRKQAAFAMVAIGTLTTVFNIVTMGTTCDIDTLTTIHLTGVLANGI